TLKKWKRLYLYYPQRFTLNAIYHFLIKKTESLSQRITNKYMTGSVRHYLMYIFGFLVIVIGGSALLLKGISIDMSQDAPVNFYELGLLVAMIVGALTVLFSKSRITSIVAVGAVGYLVSFFFVLFRAPDLALTQLVVETVTTV